MDPEFQTAVVRRAARTGVSNHKCSRATPARERGTATLQCAVCSVQWLQCCAVVVVLLCCCVVVSSSSLPLLLLLLLLVVVVYSNRVKKILFVMTALSCARCALGSAHEIFSVGNAACCGCHFDAKAATQTVNRGRLQYECLYAASWD